MSDKLLMCAYYYSFDETGCREVDLVLSAVACAGKAYHHTDQWSEHNYDGSPSEVERIQAAANAAAATIADLRTRVAELEAALRPFAERAFGYNTAYYVLANEQHAITVTTSDLRAARAALAKGGE